MNVYQYNLFIDVKGSSSHSSCRVHGEFTFESSAARLNRGAIVSCANPTKEELARTPVHRSLAPLVATFVGERHSSQRTLHARHAVLTVTRCYKTRFVLGVLLTQPQDEPPQYRGRHPLCAFHHSRNDSVIVMLHTSCSSVVVESYSAPKADSRKRSTPPPLFLLAELHLPARYKYRAITVVTLKKPSERARRLC